MKVFRLKEATEGLFDRAFCLSSKTIFLLPVFAFCFAYYIYPQVSTVEMDTVPAVQQTEDGRSSSALSGNVTKESVPVMLSCMWQSDERIVVFDTSYYDEATGLVIPNVVLKEFYGWYADRAAESSQYSKATSQDYPRDRNDATSKNPQELKIRFIPLTDELYPEEYNDSVVHENGDIFVANQDPSGAWNLEITYPGVKEPYYVPIAVIGDKLYTNFVVIGEDVSDLPDDVISDKATFVNDNILYGFWINHNVSSGFLISPPSTAKELRCYYVTNEGIYRIRYWITDMEYDGEAKASFSDKGSIYSVPKHIIVAGNTYTCVAGRGKNIRNVEFTTDSQKEFCMNSVYVQKHSFDSNGKAITYTVKTSTICGLGEPYLTLSSESYSLEELVKMLNSRKRPEAEPLFPPHGVLDFDWSIIEDPPKTYDRRMIDLGK